SGGGDPRVCGIVCCSRTTRHLRHRAPLRRGVGGDCCMGAVLLVIIAGVGVVPARVAVIPCRTLVLPTRVIRCSARAEAASLALPWEFGTDAVVGGPVHLLPRGGDVWAVALGGVAVMPRAVLA